MMTQSQFTWGIKLGKSLLIVFRKVLSLFQSRFTGTTLTSLHCRFFRALLTCTAEERLRFLSAGRSTLRSHLSTPICEAPFTISPSLPTLRWPLSPVLITLSLLWISSGTRLSRHSKGLSMVLFSR